MKCALCSLDGVAFSSETQNERKQESRSLCIPYTATCFHSFRACLLLFVCASVRCPPLPCSLSFSYGRTSVLFLWEAVTESLRLQTDRQTVNTQTDCIEWGTLCVVTYTHTHEDTHVRAHTVRHNSSSPDSIPWLVGNRPTRGKECPRHCLPSFMDRSA